MRSRREWRAALAAMGAAAGMACGSGRAFALFFAQLDGAVWPAMALASALFGLLVGLLCVNASPPEAMGPGGWALWRLRGVMAALAAAMMLARAGHLGALALPLCHAFAFGTAFALLAALPGRRSRAVGEGCAVYALSVAYYTAMALDGRPVRAFVDVETELLLADSPGWTVLMATLFACMCGGAASWSPATEGGARPLGVGMKAGGLMLAVLALQKWALSRGGDALIAHPMPWVALAARWGLPGFWLCVGVGWLCAVSTLRAALCPLTEGLRRGGHARAEAAFMIALGALVWLMLCAAGSA